MATKQTLCGDFLPAERTLNTLREAARSCKGCDLYQNATQTFSARGRVKSSIVLVGEQPGDHEDRQGRPLSDPRGVYLTKRWPKPN